MSTAIASLNSTNVRNAARFGWARLAVAVTSAVSRELAIDTAARLFTSPPRHAHTARELEFLATGTRFDVAGLDGHLAAWRFGATGRPAGILSHGWGGRGAQLRSFVPALLESGYQVVAFDHAAHGLDDVDHRTLRVDEGDAVQNGHVHAFAEAGAFGVAIR